VLRLRNGRGGRRCPRRCLSAQLEALRRHEASFESAEFEGLCCRKAAAARGRVAVLLHEVMKRVGERLPTRTVVSTVAATTQGRGRKRAGAGVAQDEAQSFIACFPPAGACRRAMSRLPAQRRSRAAFADLQLLGRGGVPCLEWWGFDPANNITLARHLAGAIGLAYRTPPRQRPAVGFGDAKMSVEASSGWWNDHVAGIAPSSGAHTPLIQGMRTGVGALQQ